MRLAHLTAYAVVYASCATSVWAEGQAVEAPGALTASDSKQPHICRISTVNGSLLTPDPLAVTPNSSADDVNLAIRCVIVNVRKLRDEIPKDIDHQGHVQTWFDSTVIGLGIASVASALARSPTPVMGAIAIGTTGLEQYRTYYNPEGRGAAYIKAVAAARCVASQAEPLLTAQPGLLWQAIANLRLAIDKVNVSAADLSGSDPATSDGSDAASKAVTAANTALAALNAEAGAYNAAPSKIDGAHDSIKNYLDQKNHRGTVVFSDILAAMNNGITAAANSEAKTQTALSQLADAMKASAKATAKSGANDGTAVIAGNATSLNAANATTQTEKNPQAATTTAMDQAKADAQAAGRSKQSADTEATAAAATAAAAKAKVAKASPAQKARAQKVATVAQTVASKAASKANAAADAKTTADAKVASASAAANATAVSALIATTADALQQMPSPKFTDVNAAITTTCTAILS